jgi:hypothetical protein
MPAALREQFANNAEDTLNGAIDASQTSIVLTNASEFPSVGNFRLIISNEMMLCTARSTNTLTVVRGVEGTTGASHSNGSVVVQILTKDGIDRWGKDNLTLFGYGSSPPLNKLVADDGSTLLTVSDFTWVNQGTATATDQNGTIVLVAPPASGENNRILARTAPATPYSYIGAFRFSGFRDSAGSIPHFGMGLRQSSSGRHTVVSILTDGNGPCRLQVANYTNATTFSATVRAREHYGLITPEAWFKVENDGTNIKYYIGFDGLTWTQIYSVSKTNFMTTTGPDELIWYGGHFNSASTWDVMARLVHWSRAS